MLNGSNAKPSSQWCHWCAERASNTWRRSSKPQDASTYISFTYAHRSARVRVVRRTGEVGRVVGEGGSAWVVPSSSSHHEIGERKSRIRGQVTTPFSGHSLPPGGTSKELLAG